MPRPFNLVCIIHGIRSNGSDTTHSNTKDTRTTDGGGSKYTIHMMFPIKYIDLFSRNCPISNIGTYQYMLHMYHPYLLTFFFLFFIFFFFKFLYIHILICISQRLLSKSIFMDHLNTLLLNN